MDNRYAGKAPEVPFITDCLRNHKDLIALVTATRKPVVLTVKGRPALVIQDADSYQALLDRVGNSEKLIPRE